MLDKRIIKTYLSEFDRIEIIDRGMSRDAKYHLYCGKDEYLLRVSDIQYKDEKQKEFLRLKKLNEAGLHVPECIQFSVTDDGSNVLTLLSWIPGETLEDLIHGMLPAEQYKIGWKAGDLLRSIHEASPVTDIAEDWSCRYNETIEPKMYEYKKEEIPFDGSDRIFKYFAENKHLLKERPQSFHHGDFHAGNLIVQKNGDVWVIDWHTMDFDSFGDPWYEFYCVDTRYPEFIKGQIDGYFAGNVPKEFWQLFAFYLSANAITSLVWAKSLVPQELDRIMQRSENVLDIFDNMTNPIPKWYR